MYDFAIPAVLVPQRSGLSARWWFANVVAIMPQQQTSPAADVASHHRAAGPITGVIHGAGVERTGNFLRKMRDTVDRRSSTRRGVNSCQRSRAGANS